MKRLDMRISLTMVALGMGLGLAAQQNIAVNATGAAADNSAILDISVAGLPANDKKGFLIPRMTQAQRPGGAVDGMTIYQTDNTPGFYYYDGTLAAWVRMTNGSPGWGILGNDLVNSANDWIGTTNAVGLSFKVNGALPGTEYMRIDETTGGRVGMGNIAPAERLDITGALRIAGTNASTTVGTIRWNDPDSLHEGYMGATAGWRALQNDYTLVQNAAYTQQATATCTPGSQSWIPDNVASIPANMSVDPRVTPWPNIAANQRMRHQHLFLKNELDVELNQLNGNTTITHGICHGQPITTLAFERAAGGNVKSWQYQVSIFHVPFGVNDLTSGFQPNSDPTFACYTPGASVNWPLAVGAGVEVVTLSTPFVWDGVRNIVIEICGNGAPGGAAMVPVKFTTVGANVTYSKNATLAGGAACNNPGTAACAPNPGVGGCDMPSGATCTANGTAGASNMRPVVRFGGTVSSTTGPATTGNGDYIQYAGGFLVQATPGWRLWHAGICPGSDPYNAHRGPGSIHAENGVYDNGVQLSDHVFDQHFDGRVQAQDLERAGTHRNLSMEEMSRFTATNRHLPTMKGRSAWERENGFSLGDLSNQLWVTSETHALYLTELNQKAHLLEVLSTDRTVPADELAPMTSIVKDMTDLTEGQKRLLVQDLNQRAQNAPNTSR